MKNYTVRTSFVFEGDFYVNAPSEEEARIIVEECCGMNMGKIHSSLGNEVVDWKFDMKADKQLLQIAETTQAETTQNE